MSHLSKYKKYLLGLGALLMTATLGSAGVQLVQDSMVANASVYGEQLTESGEATVEVEGDVELTEDLVVNGDKTLTGDGTLTLNGNITVKTGATLTVEENIEINANDADHGIVVEAGAEVILNGTVITNATSGIQNKGTVTANNIQIKDVTKHGIYNAGTFSGNGVVITNVGDLGVSNAGEMEISGLTVSGTASKVIYNSAAGNAKITGASVDGTSATHDYLVDNNGGKLELIDTTIENAKTNAVYNRNSAQTTVSNVILDYMGGNGILVESGCTLTGDKLVVNHVNLADNSEGFAIKNSGNVDNLNNVTFGDYSADVTGSGCGLDTTTASGVGKTALWLEAGTYTGSGLTIKNTDENAIYNKAVANIGDLTIHGASSGINCRNNGWVTLSGTNSIANLSGSAVRTYGAESATYNNGVKLASGAAMAVDTVGSHAINNKGSFLAAADSSLTVKNVEGTGINAINNNGGLMSLGNVDIDGVHVAITTYVDSSDNSTKINTNSGNGIMNNSELAINGAVTIQNIYITPADGLKDNSNGSGVVVKNGGKITGKGSVTVIGPETTDSTSTELPLHNGIYLQSTKMSLEGGVTVENAANQGIYIGEANGVLNAGSVTIKNVSGNGIYINNTSGAMNVSGPIVIDNAATNGINNNGGGDITAQSISVSNITQNNGIANGTGGTIEVKHDITISNISGTTDGKTQGNGISLGSGIIEAGGNVTITNVLTSGNTDNTSNNGIYAKGSLFADGNITVDGVAAGHGMFLYQTGVVHSFKDISVSNITKEGKQGMYLADAVSTSKQVCNVTAVNVTVSNVGGNGILISNHLGNTFVATGTVKITDVVKGRGFSNQGGTVAVKNLEISNIQANYNAIENKGGFNVTGTTVKVDGIVAGGHGLYNEGVFRTTAKCTTTITNVNGTKPNGIHVAKGSVKLGNVVIDGVTATSTTDTKAGNGIYNAGTLQLDGTVTIANVNSGKKDHTTNAGIVGASGSKITGKGSVTVGSATTTTDTFYNGIFLDACSMKVKGDVSVYYANNQGIYVANANAAFGAKNVTVDTATEQGVLVNNAAGSFAATGDVVLSNAKRGLQSYGTVTAKNIAVTNTTSNSYWIRGGTVTVTGDISADGSADNGMAIAGGCKIKSDTITISNVTKNDGIRTEGGSTIEANTITISNIQSQGIRFTNANTLKATTVIINTTVTQNGLWISNASANPTIEIKNLVLNAIGNRGVSASAAITNADVNIGTLWYANFTNYKSDTVDAGCFGAIYNELPTT